MNNDIDLVSRQEILHNFMYNTDDKDMRVKLFKAIINAHALAHICPKCKSLLSLDYKYCPNCGAELKVETHE